MENPLIQVKNLSKSYITSKGPLDIIKNISFDINKGETLAIVGESGCGKTTTGKLLLNLIKGAKGSFYYKGIDLFGLKEKKFKAYRRNIQMIFQDPFSSLNPRMTVKEILEEPLKIHKISIPDRSKQLLSLVKLPLSALNKYPHEFSGGQRQRIGIARALSITPEFIVLDEPISALDVSIQAQIINLLKSLQKELNLTYLFIAHDLAIVKYVSDKIAVMFSGEIVEMADSQTLFKKPLHPYTKTLLSVAKQLEFNSKTENTYFYKKIDEKINTTHFSSCCCYASICPIARELCFKKKPTNINMKKNHMVKCHFSSDL